MNHKSITPSKHIDFKELTKQRQSYRSYDAGRPESENVHYL